MEWITETNLAVADSTTEREVVDLNLDDDEVAEILAVRTSIDVNLTLGDDVNREVAAIILLSMDPTDVATTLDLFAAAQREDLEVFYEHKFVPFIEVQGTANGFALNNVNQKYVVFPMPVIVANNISMQSEHVGTLDDTADYTVTVYFKRKKATDFELARTLLKRR